jgi:hypothetical protein
MFVKLGVGKIQSEVVQIKDEKGNKKIATKPLKKKETEKKDK